MSGRTFNDRFGRRVLHVPEGYWALELSDNWEEHYTSESRPKGEYETRTEIIGQNVSRTAINSGEDSGDDWEGGYERSVYTASEPFGLVQSFLFNGKNSNDGILEFYPSRQIHKGEFGRMSDMNMPPVVQTTEGIAGKSSGFVRIGDLAERARFGGKPGSFDHLIETYYPFFRPEWIIAEEPQDFEGREVRYPQWFRGSIQQFKDALYKHPDKYLWVPASFAADVLRMKALDYKPDLSKLQPEHAAW